MLQQNTADDFLENYLSGAESTDVAKRIAENQAMVGQVTEDWVPPAGPELVENPENKKLPKRTLAAVFIILLLIPITIWVGLTYGGDRKYMLVALCMMFYTMAPFFMVFEGRKPKAREIMVLAVLIAIAVVGRMAFFMVPHFKPVTAIVIIAGVCFGAESGFMVGAMSGFMSNFFFGQGPWTPYQMFSWGIIGFLAGILFRKGMLKAKKSSLCIFGFLATFFIYGGLMDTATPLMFYQGELKLMSFLPYYVSGAPVNLVHAISTVIFLFIAARVMIEKLERIKVKYGLIE
ncbi:MAG: ECF transporter S component [Eubacterium sp.]|nr:ECF transporter S component [Eubacterium sp.]